MLNILVKGRFSAVVTLQHIEGACHPICRKLLKAKGIASIVCNRGLVWCVSRKTTRRSISKSCNITWKKATEGELVRNLTVDYHKKALYFILRTVVITHLLTRHLFSTCYVSNTLSFGEQNNQKYKPSQSLKVLVVSVAVQ